MSQVFNASGGSGGGGGESLAATLAIGNVTGGTDISISAGDSLVFNNSSFTGTLDVTTLTANRAYTLQDGTGTLAFLSDITTPDWATVLAVGAVTGGSSPLIEDADSLIFGTGSDGSITWNTVDSLIDVTGGDWRYQADINMGTSTVIQNIDFVATASTSSRARFFGSSSKHGDIYMEQENGDIWYFDYVGAGTPEVKFIQSGGVGEISKFTIDSDDLTLGSQGSGNIVINFDALTNDGTLTWSNTNNRFSINQTLEIVPFSSAGFVKNDASGILSGGNSIDISDDTNLAVSSPITLTGDTIGFDFSTNNVWAGTNEYQNDVTFTSSVTGNPTLFWDESVHSFDWTFNPNGTNDHFNLVGNITTAPSSSPNYFNLDLQRSWTGSNLLADIMRVYVDDDRTLNAGLPSLTTLFHFTYDMDDLTGHSNAEHPIGFRVDFIGSPDLQADLVPTWFGFGTDGTNSSTFSPQYNSSSTKTITANLCTVGQVVYPTNNGTGGMVVNYNAVNYLTNHGLIAGTLGIGPDTVNSFGINDHAQANLFTGNTLNHYGIYHNPTFTASGGTVNTYGMYYDPNNTLSSGTINQYIIWAVDSDDIVLANDGSRILFGAGQDMAVGEYDGSIFHLARPLATTSSIVVNEDGLDTDFRIEGDTATQLFVTDAGLGAVRIGTTTVGIIADFRSSAIVFNENGANRDFRVEGDTDVNLFFCDASADFIGIGNNAPAVKLDLTGNMRIRAGGEIRFADSDSSNYLGWKSPATVSSDFVYQMPPNGSDDQILSLVDNTTGETAWVSPNTVGATTVIYRTADQSITSSSMTNDDTFSISMAANTNYAFRAVMFMTLNSSNSAHIVDLNGPSSPTNVWYEAHVDSADVDGLVNAYGTELAFVIGSTDDYIFVIEGSVRNGSTSGTLNIRHRILTAVATDTIQDGSYMVFWEI